MSNYMTMVVNSIIAVVQGAAASVQNILNGMANAARAAAATIGGILSQIASSIQSTVNQAAQAAGNAGNAITDAFSGAWNTVANAAVNFYNWLVGHSLWPDLMDALVSQTEAGMSQVKASFEKGLDGVAMGAPTIPELTAAMNITGPRAAGASPTQAAATPALSQPASITLPITINNQIDGATVARTVERRLIANRQLSAWRTA
jgi:phage-related protein